VRPKKRGLAIHEWFERSGKRDDYELVYPYDFLENVQGRW